MLYSGKKYYILAALTIVFSAISHKARSAYLSAQDIYNMARNQHGYELSQLGSHLETTDADGNTALCLAAARNDTQAYNTLLQYGANPHPSCLSYAGAGKSGIKASTVGWTALGVAAVGGGIAIAASGGGGGGGGGSSDKPTDKCGSEYVTTPCATTEYMTKCEADATRHKCQTRTNTKNCESYADEADICTACVTGYSLNSGNCNSCDSAGGYIDDGSGNCILACGPEYVTTPCAEDEYMIKCDIDASRHKCQARENTKNCSAFAAEEDVCTECTTGYLLNDGSCNVCDTANDYIDDGSGNCVPKYKKTTINTDTIIIRDKTSESSDEESIGMIALNDEKTVNRGSIQLLDNDREVDGMYADGKEEGNSTIINEGEISGSGNNIWTIGMKAINAEAINAGNITLNDNINNSYGMHGADGSQLTNKEGASISMNDNVLAYAMYGYGNGKIINENGAEITMTGNDLATGMSNYDGTIFQAETTNFGTIRLSENGASVGMAGYDYVVNQGGGLIDITLGKDIVGYEHSPAASVGMNAYGKESAFALNYGTINIKQNFVDDDYGKSYGIIATGNASNDGSVNVSENGGKYAGGVDATMVVSNGDGMWIIYSGDVSNSGSVTLNQNTTPAIVGIRSRRVFEYNPDNPSILGVDAPGGTAENDGSVTLSENSGVAFGIYTQIGTLNNNSRGSITLNKNSDSAYGMMASYRTNEAIEDSENLPDAADSSILNAGTVSLSENTGGRYAGILAESGGNGNGGGIEVTNSGTVNLSQNSGNSYGIYGNIFDGYRLDINNSGNITLSGNSGANAYGIYVEIEDEDNENLQASATNSGSITLSKNNYIAYGMYSINGATITNAADGEININENSGKALGMSVYKGTAENSGSITLSENNDWTYGMLAEGIGTVKNSGTITSSKNSGNTYGMHAYGGDSSAENSGTITLSKNDSYAYGMLTGNYAAITNTADGVITLKDNEGISYGMYVYKGTAENSGSITLSENIGDSYGMLTDRTGTVKNSGTITSSKNNTMSIGMRAYTEGTVKNSGTITLTENKDIVYGIAVRSKGTAENSGTITLSENDGKALGIYATEYAALGPTTITNTADGKIALSKNKQVAVGIEMDIPYGSSENYGTITLSKNGGSPAVGMALFGHDSIAENFGTITLSENSGNTAYGMYTFGEDKNSGTITLKDNEGISYGMYSSKSSTATNTVDGEINIDGAEVAIGIFAEDGTAENKTKVTNAGNIRISNAEHAYGIWAEGENVEVTNTGIIRIDGAVVSDVCTGEGCAAANHAIVLNGGTLVQNGLIQATSVHLDSFGGEVIASSASHFEVDDTISGDLTMSSDVVSAGFDTVYTVEDMIKAGNAEDLHLQSQSALFSAALENDSDAVMTMKAFADVVEDGEIADFLQNNYAEGNNEQLFSALKSTASVAELNGNLDDLFGKDMLSRMAFEDLMMVREVNLNMNQHLFEQKGAFAFADNVSPSGYDNNLGSVGRYSLNGYNNGKMSFGVGVAITDVRTATGHGDNSRFDRNFMLSAPVGYNTHGFELITAPKMGYADGTYNRDGYNNMSYEGKVQKRMLALMNEVRYPFDFGGVKIIPTAELNAIGYNIKGHEDEKEYSLRLKSQNRYSLETGLGLAAQKEFKPLKNHKFNLSGGVAVYHEFADPYTLDVAMNGMSGTYRLHDEKHSDNRAAVRFGFGYTLKDYLEVTADLLTDINREYRTDAGINLKYSF